MLQRRCPASRKSFSKVNADKWKRLQAEIGRQRAEAALLDRAQPIIPETGMEDDLEPADDDEYFEDDLYMPYHIESVTCVSFTCCGPTCAPVHVSRYWPI